MSPEWGPIPAAASRKNGRCIREMQSASVCVRVNVNRFCSHNNNNPARFISISGRQRQSATEFCGHPSRQLLAGHFVRRINMCTHLLPPTCFCFCIAPSKSKCLQKGNCRLQQFWFAFHDELFCWRKGGWVTIAEFSSPTIGRSGKDGIAKNGPGKESHGKTVPRRSW